MKPGSYKNYMVIVLMIVLAFNSVDRLALGLLLQDIKVDLDLTDTQLGLLTGIAFAIFYSTMGIPIAYWADRGNRVKIIAITTALWSFAAALCGAATTFAQLLLIRVGVAVGEAGCMPTANSLIADYYTRAERARAMAKYMIGGPLSLLIGYMLAGWLNEFFGWRMTFVLLGVPGLLLAALVWLTLKEPRNEVANNAASLDIAPPASIATRQSLFEVLGLLQRNRTFRHIVLAFSVSYFFSYGITQWKAAFFIRSFGLSTGELGTLLSLTTGFGSLLGTYLGGELATRYAANNERMQLKAMALARMAFGIITALIYLSPTPLLAFVFMTLSIIDAALVTAPLFSIIQTVVPERMRASAVALIFLFANLVGMGLGPLAAGMLSDAFQPWAGQESLRYALLALCPGFLWVGWHYWQASKWVEEDLAEAEQQNNDAAGKEVPSAS